MISLHKGEYGLLLFNAFEDDGTTPLPIVGKVYKFVVSHSASKERHEFNDFTMLETSFALEIPTDHTLNWRAGKYNIQLEEISTHRLIDVEENGLELKESY